MSAITCGRCGFTCQYSSSSGFSISIAEFRAFTSRCEEFKERGSKMTDADLIGGCSELAKAVREETGVRLSVLDR